MKQMVNSKYLLGAALCCMSLFSAATAQAVEFKGVAGLGLDFGGDVLASVNDAGSTLEVRANEGFGFNGGVVMVTGSFETQATVGYKFGESLSKKGSVTFFVVPVELMAFYRTSNLRMGAGFSYHNSPKVVEDIPGTSATYKFDNALGTVVQIGYAPKISDRHLSSISLDLRYTAIKYKQSGVDYPPDFSGNSVGLYMGFIFK